MDQAKAVLDNEKATEKDVKDAVLAIKDATEQLKKLAIVHSQKIRTKIIRIIKVITRNR